MKERGNKLYKLLDCFIGIPLIFFLQFFRRKGKLPESIMSVRIIQFGAIGDTILLSAVLHDLKDSLPHLKVSAICSKGNQEVVQNMHELDSFFVFDLKSPIKSFKMLRRLAKTDVLLDFTPWAKIGALLSFFCKATYKIGFKRKKMYRHYIYDNFVEHTDNVHELENYKKLIKSIGIARTNLPCFFVPQEFERKLPQKFVVFHPYPGGTKSFMREWAEENWYNLGTMFLQRGYSIFITGGKSDTIRAEKLANRYQSVLVKSLAGVLVLQETAALLTQAQVLITVNTGILHLGDALGIPVISLNGPTNIVRWGGIHQTTLNLTPQNISCSPCLSLGFEYACKDALPRCMQAITVEKVLSCFENNVAE